MGLDMIWIILAFLGGLFLPAPYEDLAKSAARSVWAWIKSVFVRTE